jgi:hypothetical protein
MDAQILHLGVFDKKGSPHFVSFHAGVNVVTGRSSTGKSALIEIFDYCFGASEFTVPVGVITDNTDIYFVSLRIEKRYVLLSRTEMHGGKGMIQEFTDENLVHPLKANVGVMLNPDLLIPDGEYVKRLSRLFGLNITDVDDDLKERERRGRRKGTPSVRSFSSFMLQHQNLVANKHALFYRFDEQRKREPVIEQFFIFLGLVDGEYYQMRQSLAELRRSMDGLVRYDLPDAQRRQAQCETTVQANLDRFRAASGTVLDLGDWKSDPAKAATKADESTLHLDPLSIEHIERRSFLESNKSSLMAERREIERSLRLILSTEQQIAEYQRRAEVVPTPHQGTEGGSYCHFCRTTHSGLDNQAKQLSDAITWLNVELSKLRVMPESLAEDRNVQERLLASNAEQIISINKELAVLDQQVVDLQNKRTHLEIATKAKVGVVEELRTMANNPVWVVEAKIEDLKKSIAKKEKELKDRYDTVDYTNKVQKRLRELMNDIGSGFDFESSFTPIDLHFSVETFELWAVRDGKEVPLRSMGSGANWLSCHMTLFLSLHRYFCELGSKCKIPSILFFDQPSQVYFPSVLDTDEEFSPDKIAMRSADAKVRTRDVDEDVKAVANLFSQMVKVCRVAKDETGFQPQIIVTDHADRLKLDGELNFESLVRAKWRGVNDGLIKLPVVENNPLSDIELLIEFAQGSSEKSKSVPGAEEADAPFESGS